MPQYSFYCECGAEAVLTLPMSEAGKKRKCVCGKRMHRNFQADLPNTSGRDYYRPIVSDALAVMPHQIEEHRKEFPNIPLTPKGQPVFDNFSDHDAYLKKTGFRKIRKRIKRKPTSSGK